MLVAGVVVDKAGWMVLAAGVQLASKLKVRASVMIKYQDLLFIAYSFLDG